ncbi:hypothetical protein HAHE_29700 [Haloferula helveola]|uniref:Uncharacterized protein n=1 Tax=Haloferula helveola TaxID=490095 RepID=A0ABN6H5W6_9BACT|nr:hypothetical protein HAHE_29700 [Haloferula helveola]
MNPKTHPNIPTLSALAFMLVVTSSSGAESFTFGSNNDGLAGFTQSTPADADEIWTEQTDSVQYRNQSPGTRNSSFLRAFSVDRAAGRSYRIEGTLTLTDGYTDDNNRVGIYLFGDSQEVPNEAEAGAFSLIFNTDDSSSAGPPGNNADDRIYLANGIDNGVLASQIRTQTITPYAQDLFGTTITLSVDFTFTSDGNIDVEGRLTTADGEVTTVSTSVVAADYPGNFFGFVTRARARNILVNPPSPEDRSLPWVMDYVSFSFTGLGLSIAPNAGTPGNFDFEWDSKEGKVYDLVSSTDLVGSPDTWPVWDGQLELSATPPLNTLSDVPGGGGARRFFAVVEKDPPPIFAESFDAAGPGLPAGWVAVNATTVWDVGDPSLLPGLAGGDGTNCVGTNVVTGLYANEVATVTLTSPSIAIPAGGATLNFRQYIDSDAFNGDVGAIRLLDGSDIEIVDGDFPVTGIDGVQAGWSDEAFALPASANGQNVKIVFEFTTAADGTAYYGFYVDDVAISAN